MPNLIHATQHQQAEWSLNSTVAYDNPFRDVEVDIVATHEDGTSIRVPAFWSGGNEWRFRLISRKSGTYEIETVCNDTANQSLHGIAYRLTVDPSRESMQRISDAPRIVDGRLVDERGEPFMWLGDTWWMALARRFTWPADFKTLTADRVQKGFTVVQIVAGLHPDMPAFDDRCANEAGLPWLSEENSINPAYFDMADERIVWLVRSGLIPCIVASWGYYLPILGVENIKRYWRYLIARWGAYPVIYCLAGEAAMPYYLATDKQKDAKLQKQGWTEVARYVRDIDPYKRLITIHPTTVGREQIDDATLLDFDMLQTGHGGETIFNLIRLVAKNAELEPSMPVIVGEANYEGIFHDSGPEHQRRQYWISMLTGAAGYTYGANGLFQVNTETEQFGPSPHGANWGDATWDETRQYPGAFHIGLGARYLAGFGWQHMEYHPDWVSQPDDSSKDKIPPVAAGIPGSFRLVYLYEPVEPWSSFKPQVQKLENDVEYEAVFWDPRRGVEHRIGRVTADSDGNWEIPYPPTMSDWLLVLRS